MSQTDPITIQLAPDTARHFGDGQVAYENTRHQVHLLAACRRADRGQRVRIDAPLWEVTLTRQTIHALIEHPTQDPSSVFHHQLVKACRDRVREADGLRPINNNPPCQLCHKVYADQFFMEGIWAHDGCLDTYYENAA